MSTGYARSIHVVLRWRYLLILLFVAGLAGTVYMYQHVPTSFVPQEDQGYIICRFRRPLELPWPTPTNWRIRPRRSSCMSLKSPAPSP